MKELVLFSEGSRINLRTEGEMSSLTDLWKAAGAPKNKDPREWLRFESTMQLTDTVMGILNVGENHIIKTKKGKGGGTWAHKQIALAYAKYLDPKLHLMVNQVFFERIEEEKNPDLIVDRAIKTYEKKGKTAEWISQRLEGKGKRNEFTSTLAKHGVVRAGFSNCTNNIYAPLWGGGSNVVRMKKGLSKKDNIRDNMSDIELDAVKFAESLAKNRIEKYQLSGNAQCEEASLMASMSVRDALKTALH